MKVLGGIFLGFLILIIGLAIVAASGSYNVAALNSPSKLEQRLATFTLNRSIAKRAPATKNPFPASPDTLRAGLAHYKENCVTCHGAPGVEESEAGMGLNPPAPDLTLPAVRRMSDGELFWVISNGIRMTGMPAFSLTHNKDQIWKVVSFVRHLPEISNEEQKVLKEGSEEAEHHDGEAVGDEGKGPSSPPGSENRHDEKETGKEKPAPAAKAKG